jgi:maltose-binding protein MalE
VTLIYNKTLLDGPPPMDLSQLKEMSQKIRNDRPGTIPILWDSTSPYYIWGILASAGGYVFAKTGGGYNTENIGIATPGCCRCVDEDPCLDTIPHFAEKL